MSAIDQRFEQLHADGRKALIPFITAGDPDLKTTAALLAELDARGASIIELGIPYSDPIADGPVIQASYTRALERHVTLDEIFSMVASIAGELSSPLVSMVSYATVYRHGLEQYVRDAQAAGLSGAIVADLPVEESGPLAEVCRASDFSLVQLVTPTTPRERALRIAKSSTGFLYYVSVTGITGTRDTLPDDLADKVAQLRQHAAVPVAVGFGISRAEHVRRLAPVADGLIVGSAIVRQFDRFATQATDEVVASIGEFVAQLRSAMDESAA